ncbi:hypothetical protein K7432_014386 [Basidiobolus ranarum]|uniref:Uncharacterized protein n=1 Tax=Basidiobolus ranarum TaxID=34480 RepID=A0ABR2VPK9_9FUNG
MDQVASPYNRVNLKFPVTRVLSKDYLPLFIIALLRLILEIDLKSNQIFNLQIYCHCCMCSRYLIQFRILLPVNLYIRSHFQRSNVKEMYYSKPYEIL